MKSNAESWDDIAQKYVAQPVAKVTAFNRKNAVHTDAEKGIAFVVARKPEK